MHAAYERDFAGADTAVWHAHFPEPAPSIATPPEPSRYGERRANLPAIATIVAVHAALLTGLVMFDVIPLHRAPPPTPLVIELLRETPPPPAIVQAKPVDPPIVAPAPMVRMPPPPVAVVETAPPVVQTPVVVAVVAPVAVATPTPAPSTGPVDHPDVLPQTLSRAELRYPTESRRQKEQGTVVLQVLITTGGTVADIKVRQSSGFDRLDDAALASVRRWRFRAALKDGQAVMAWGVVAIPFQIKA